MQSCSTQSIHDHELLTILWHKATDIQQFKYMYTRSSINSCKVRTCKFMYESTETRKPENRISKKEYKKTMDPIMHVGKQKSSTIRKNN